MFNFEKEIQVTVLVQAGVMEQDLFSFTLQGGLTTTTCKVGDHFGRRSTAADETVFSPVDTRQPAKRGSRSWSQRTPGKTLGVKLSEGASSALTFLRCPIPNLSSTLTHDS
ncbi:hypothetical protein MRX96_010917 [Rhipicephalus microplus]